MPRRSLYEFLNSIFHQNSHSSPQFLEFLFQYSSKWFTLVNFSCWASLVMLIFQIIVDFTCCYTATISILQEKLACYIAVLIPSIIALIYVRLLKGKTLDYKKFEKINAVLSGLSTTLMVLYLLLKLDMISDVTLERKPLINVGMEIFIATFVSMTFYLILWVLIQIFYIKLVLLIIHFTTILLFSILFLKINFFYVIKLGASILLILIFMIIYSAYREKQTYDSFAFNKQKETIQEDWKNIVNDFPNGVILLSLKKNIYYLNKSVLDLFELNNLDIPENLNTSLDKNANEKQQPEKLTIHLDSLYKILVERIGKIEEVNSFRTSLETVNGVDFKQSDGFSIMESSDFTIHSLKTPLNIKKKCILGCNPVNISSNSFPLKMQPSSHSSSQLRSAGFLSVRNKFPSGDASPNNSAHSRPQKCKELIGSKCKDFEKCKTQKIDLAQVEMNLDNVINKMRKKMKITSKKLKDSKLDDFKNLSSSNEGIKTYCTQYKTFHESCLSRPKKKYELKIKSIFYKNETVFLIIIQDVSYMDVVQELRENNEYKTKVLTTLSHELRTPLNGAIAPLERMLHDKNLQIHPILQEFDILNEMDISYKSMMLLQSVMNDVVDFALINSNQLYLNYEELNFYRFLKETLELFNKQSDEKNIELELQYETLKKLPKKFKTDFQRLRQILVSLLNNSLKNTFKGSIKLKIELLNGPVTNSSLMDNVSTHKISKIKENLNSLIDSPTISPKRALIDSPNNTNNMDNMMSSVIGPYLEISQNPIEIAIEPSPNLDLSSNNIDSSIEAHKYLKFEKNTFEKIEPELDKILDVTDNSKIQIVEEIGLYKEFIAKTEGTKTKTMGSRMKKPNYYKEKTSFSSLIHKYIIKITVSDTGVGIDQNKLENIRKCLSSKDLLEVCNNLNRKKGCGVGLTISHCLALLLGPQNCKGLEIVSEANQGTNVFFFLEAYLESNREEEEEDEASLSVIEEAKFENSKYSTVMNNSTNQATRYSINPNKTFITSNSLELINRKRQFLKSETTLNLPNLLKKDILRSESEHYLDHFTMLGVQKSSRISETARDFEKPNISDFITNHIFETHAEALSYNKSACFLMSNNCVEQESSFMKLNMNDRFLLSPLYASMNINNGSSILQTNLDSINNEFQVSQLASSSQIKMESLEDHQKIKKTCNCEDILIVDDDSFNLLALEGILSKFHIDVVKAFNGEQALKIIKEKNAVGRCGSECTLFRMMILDYHMPIMDGVETTKEIKNLTKNHNLPEFPIIACTAFGAKNLVETWNSAGMSDFVVKPINSLKMENLLKKWKIIN